MTVETTAGTACRITVEPAGRHFTAEPGETILAAAIRAGVPLPYGCRDGACGSCKCRKLSGEIQLGPHQSQALGAGEAEAGFALTCCAHALGDVVLESRRVGSVDALPIRRMPARVQALSRSSRDVMRLHLQLPPGQALGFHAGQYIEFILRDGARRSYSMANAPHTLAEPGACIELHIRHMPGGKFTDHVFGALKEKDVLRIEGPYGSFYLRDESEKPIVLLASGTGFAPIKALLEHMKFTGTQRPVSLYWGGRRPEDLYMDAWVRAHLAAMPNLRYVPVLSDATPGDAWEGRRGFVHKAVMEDFADLSGIQVYACGAPIVIESARREYVAERGLPPDEFFADAFTSEVDKHESSEWTDHGKQRLAV
jgi:CDP-4-dehydro-6-deoxyglucose reductase